MRYERRLHALTRRLGLTCPCHQDQLLRCPACEPQAPLPDVLEDYLHAVFNSLMARVDRERLRVICYRHLPPRYAPCGCGRPRQCSSCQVRFTKAVLDDIGLTADEARLVDEALALARGIDATRNTRP